MEKFPVLEYEPPERSKEPVLQTTPKDRKWSFSFRYWNQIEYFGLSGSQPKWFVSLLEKLKDLSRKEIEQFISSKSEKDAWRYHKINWNHTNIPIQRKELSWVDKAYLDNEDEYPLLQFQVSTALGRVVGFWDENNIFNIVLLDPLHNIQPSKDYEYKISPCSPLNCEYTTMLQEIDLIKNSSLCVVDCGYHARLKLIPTDMPSANVLMHYISDEQKALVDSTLQSIGDKSSYTDLLLFAADQLSSCS